jgi:2-polyprenyl-3-methyl-5-hydroxy-6-metoxy-1,4-benzoquinol methylase
VSTATPTTDAITDGRFPFGENWRRFLEVLDDSRIREAELSLREWLGVEDLRGRRFLDVGCGSGLFSLAAYNLGAERVHSLDYDPSSVGCAQELRRRYGDEERWTIERGDALDADYIGSLGEWDVVYSWGVLHHTGDMWKGLANVAPAVKPGGRLFIAIYNDQQLRSRIWRAIKKGYNALPPGRGRTAYAVAAWLPRESLSLGMSLATGHPIRYVKTWTQYKRSRGMSRWHDIIDWIGGYPFEVAKPEEIFEFYRDRGFRLDRLFTAGGGLGCNQFVFTRLDPR